MTSSHPWERPFKVWSYDRSNRKSVIASSLIELKLRGAEKLGYDELNLPNYKLVLESDGTEVEDESYFQSASKDTVFLLLRADEKWLPPGVEVLKAAITAIPEIVCDALNKMELVDKPPSWKIMDNRGNVTVVLHWDHRDRGLIGSTKSGDSTWRFEVVSGKPDGKTTSAQGTSGTLRSSLSANTTPSSSMPPVGGPLRAKLSLDGLKPRLSTSPSSMRTLPKDFPVSPNLVDYEDDDISEDDKGTKEYDHDHSQCDFHCSALHRDGAQINVEVKNSIATSPIQDIVPTPPSMSSTETVPSVPKKSTGKGQHVRFMDVEVKKIQDNGSDSETETTEREEELYCDRYLLLVDQLSVNQDTHLTLKDIGIILERLSSKIVDVDKLEREKESPDCFNWIIKATIRGEILREIGVVYNGQYYGITEHPGYF